MLFIFTCLLAMFFLPDNLVSYGKIRFHRNAFRHRRRGNDCFAESIGWFSHLLLSKDLQIKGVF